jgi:hypothetical protein
MIEALPDNFIFTKTWRYWTDFLSILESINIIAHLKVNRKKNIINKEGEHAYSGREPPGPTSAGRLLPSGQRPRMRDWPRFKALPVRERAMRVDCSVNRMAW